MKHGISIFFLVGSLLIFQCHAVSCAQDRIVLNTDCIRNGDLIFQAGAPAGKKKSTEGKGGGIDITKAVAESTTGKGDIGYTHVGIICLENGIPYVIEAATSGVRETLLSDFIGDSAVRDGEPLVALARVKDTTAISVEDAVERAKKLIGKGYDYYYRPGNGLYYCSELVYDCYLMHDGTHLFETVSMSFKDRSGRISPLWKKHFGKLGVAVPEGVTGTNPEELSKSRRLFFLYVPRL
ncbi:MAG: hypothetical protein LKK19_06685 [Bacteroidales bacterium]|jgi:hypothetical protein|nr:hypothetical protein [Bacteroidales bacterium]MCI2122370.1 hypothetical protein [Bacteroidales bacterium]MCI2146266.1 hypothetical protein [Bacteroidales bacterium]